MNNLFGGAYSGRNVLVTGHTGFKGSWLCLWLTTLGAQVSGLALAPDTEPSHWNLLDLKTVQDLRVDLRDAAATRQKLEELRPEIVFHLAAQPLVRRSYREPLPTFATNIMGLAHLMEAIRTTGSVRALISVATDKVYQEQDTAGYREDDPLGGHDPYSTSKACAELVTECYRKSFFSEGDTRVASARAGNVIGGGDWSEDRLIPDMVRAKISGDILRIRNPHAIRPWQHVLEPLSGYLRLGQQLLSGEAVEGPWNFGPAADATLSVEELISRATTYWPDLHTAYQAGPHPHEAAVLRLDCAKSERHLGWKPVWNMDDAIRHTIEWYSAYYGQSQLRSNEDMQAYIDAACAADLEWTA